MPPGNITNINLIGLSYTLLMGVLLIFLPRRLAPIPILLTACFMTYGQKIDIAGLNFYMLRIVILVGWTRVVFRKEILGIKLNTIDNAIICWVISNMIIYILLRQNSEAFINRLGLAFNTLGLYFLFRFLIRDFGDIDRVFRALAIIAVPFASLILLEYVTERNLFAILGGNAKVHEVTQIRHDALRCMGPFRHPITVGTFGALLVPLSAILWFKEKGTRLLAITVFISGTFITLASGSSGPLITYLCVIVGLLMWHFRKNVKAIRWGTFYAVVALHIYMKAPVWFLSARISSSLGGGSGYYRAVLIDRALEHFDEWWLLGTDHTVHWTGHAATGADPNMADLPNYYIRQGVDGGLLTMVLFIFVIVLCFRSIADSLQIMENQALATKITLWSIGTMLFAHAVTLISVTYFDQMIVFWYLLLAIISTSSDVSQAIQDKMRDTSIDLQDA